jgi:hypothetical protein
MIGIDKHYFKREFLTISELVAFARCPRFYFYSAGCGLKLADPTSSGERAMQYGEALHKALPVVLSTADLTLAHEAFMSAWDGFGDDMRNEANAKIILFNFLNSHLPNNSLYTIQPPPANNLAVSEKISDWEIQYAISLPTLPIPLVGRMDGWCRTRYGNELWGIEYKTASKMMPSLLQGFKRNPQILGYTAAMRVQGYDLKGVFVEIVGTQKVDKKNATVPIQPLNSDLDDFVSWATLVGRQILDCEASADWPKDVSACSTYPQFGEAGYMCRYDPLCSMTNWTDMLGIYKVDRHLPIQVKGKVLP